MTIETIAADATVEVPIELIELLAELVTANEFESVLQPLSPMIRDVALMLEDAGHVDNDDEGECSVSDSLYASTEE